MSDLSVLVAGRHGGQGVIRAHPRGPHGLGHTADRARRSSSSSPRSTTSTTAPTSNGWPRPASPPRSRPGGRVTTPARCSARPRPCAGSDAPGSTDVLDRARAWASRAVLGQPCRARRGRRCRVRRRRGSPARRRPSRLHDPRPAPRRCLRSAGSSGSARWSAGTASCSAGSRSGRSSTPVSDG